MFHGKFANQYTAAVLQQLVTWLAQYAWLYHRWPGACYWSSLVFNTRSLVLYVWNHEWAHENTPLLFDFTSAIQSAFLLLLIFKVLFIIGEFEIRPVWHIAIWLFIGEAEWVQTSKAYSVYLAVCRRERAADIRPVRHISIWL